MTTPSDNLTRLFQPPAHLHGTHMLICGMTAEADILNAALEAFTGEVGAAHAARGRLVGLLMLDARQPLFAPDQISGLMQIAPPAAESWSQRTRLLHAKVALLGFGPSPFGKTTHMRLIVSTGNWTRSAFGRGEIDLYWQTECALYERGPSHTDCGLALKFFIDLLQRVFRVDRVDWPPLMAAWLQAWDDAFSRLRGKGKARFIHSLESDLIGQIVTRFRDKTYGTLLCGSGFFEQPKGDGAAPEVFRRIEQELCNPSTQRAVIVNKHRAGALAAWFARSNPNWIAYRPADPLSTRGGRDALHAKFIAGVRGGEKLGWRIACLYLGSGNLSRRGLISHASLKGGRLRQEAGNIEAGVVVEPHGHVGDVWRALACGQRYKNNELHQFAPGEGDLDDAEVLGGPPVRWFRVKEDQLIPEWNENSERAQMRWNEVWLDLDANSDIDQRFERMPQSVRVRHQPNEPEFIVPVFGADKSYCRIAPVPMTADSALDAILSFPRYTPIDEQADDGDAGPDDPNSDGDEVDGAGRSALKNRPRTPKLAHYPVRWMAALLEGIARQHEVLSRDQYDVWFSHLRMLLCEQVREEERAAIGACCVEPFDALLEDGFRPRDMSEAAQKQYEALIDAIRRSWNCTKNVEPKAGQA